MKIVFIRHGAKRSSESDPELTSYGRKMAFETGQWLAKCGHIPHLIYSTSTLRTLQTAEECLFACELEIPIQSIDIPEQWEEWLDFLEKLGDDGPHNIAFVGHHPTMHLLTAHYNLDVPNHHFASAIVLEKQTTKQWQCIDSWPGRAS